MIDTNNLEATLTHYGIPEKMHGGFRRYIFDKVEPGSFLAAILRNDLMDSYRCADDENQLIIRFYVMFLYNEMPPNLLGAENMAKWCAEREVEG